MNQKLLIASLLLLALHWTSAVIAQDESRDAEQLAQLREELAVAQTELAEAARRMAEIRRELATEQLGLEQSSRVVIQMNDEVIEIDDLHELSEMEFQNAIGSRLEELEGINLARVGNFPPRLGIILDESEDALTITGVTPNSGAADAGIQTGDILLAVNGQVINPIDANSVRDILSEFTAGDTVTVEIERDGELLAVDVVTGSPFGHFEWVMDTIASQVPGMGLNIVMDSSGNLQSEDIRGPIAPGAPRPPGAPVLGRLDIFPPEVLGRNTDLISNHAGLAPYFGTSDGVVVLRIDEDNALNLRSGDVLLRINQQLINDPVDLGRQWLSNRSAGDTVTLEIMREGALTQVQGTVPAPADVPGVGQQRHIHIERHPEAPKPAQRPEPPSGSF